MNIYTHGVVNSYRKGGSSKKKYKHDVELAEMQKQERKGRYQKDSDDEEDDDNQESDQEEDEEEEISLQEFEEAQQK